MDSRLLGLIFDESYKGPGLKVAEILQRGPADKRGLDIKAGDIVLSIDRAELTDKVNVSKLLNNKIGEAVLLEVASDPKDAKKKRRVEIIGANRIHTSQLMMYERWVKQNADAVSKASGGKSRLHPHSEYGRRRPRCVHPFALLRSFRQGSDCD